MRYSEGFKAAIVKKTQDGNGRSVYQVAQETVINSTILKNWISQYKHDTVGMDGCDSLTPSQRNPEENLALLLESRNISEEEQAEWLRRHGMHSEHLALWEQELIRIINDKQTDLKAENAELKKANKQLQKENKRKTAMIFQFMDTNRNRWSIGKMAKIFGVSSSGYYAWKGRKPSHRILEDAALLD